jgi:hypothetical protein
MDVSDRVTEMNSAKTSTQFVIAINNHDVKCLTALMAADNKVEEWRVFADNKPVYEIIARRQA